MKSQIELKGSMTDVLCKLSEGNPGAMMVCMELLASAKEIDPETEQWGLGGLGALLTLNMLSLSGSKIWMLFKDVCGSDIPQMLAVLRGVERGLLTKSQVHHAVENRGAGIDLPTICSKVVELLPKFQLSPKSVTNL